MLFAKRPRLCCLVRAVLGSTLRNTPEQIQKKMSSPARDQPHLNRCVQDKASLEMSVGLQPVPVSWSQATELQLLLPSTRGPPARCPLGSLLQPGLHRCPQDPSSSPWGSPVPAQEQGERAGRWRQGNACRPHHLPPRQSLSRPVWTARALGLAPEMPRSHSF